MHHRRPREHNERGGADAAGHGGRAHQPPAEVARRRRRVRHARIRALRHLQVLGELSMLQVCTIGVLVNTMNVAGLTRRDKYIGFGCLFNKTFYPRSLMYVGGVFLGNIIGKVTLVRLLVLN